MLDIKNRNVPAIAAKKGLVAFPVLPLASQPAQFHELRPRSQPDISDDLDLNYHTNQTQHRSIGVGSDSSNLS